MESILLKRKPQSKTESENLVVFDELIQGVLTSEWFIPVFTGSDNGMRIMPLTNLIENYFFPEKQGQPQARMLHFIRGANPFLFESIGFYESDVIVIDNRQSSQENAKPVHLKMDLLEATFYGEKHPQLIMEELGITYQHVTPQSLFDQIWFWNCENLPEKLPIYLSPLNCNPMDIIGNGLSMNEAMDICDYINR